MRAVLFEGTPEEFARVEAMFRAGGDPSPQTRSIILPQSRPKAWPELDEEHCYQLAKRVLERVPASLAEALAALAEAQDLHGEQNLEDWASYANMLPEELGGTLAELGRGASRAFIELFGCDHAPQRVKGAAYMLLEKVPSRDGTYFAVRPGLMRALADMDLLETPPMPDAIEEALAPAPAPTATTSRSSRAAKAPPAAARRVPPRQPMAARSDAVRRSGSPGGFLGDVARALSPFAGSTRSPAPAPLAVAEEPARAPESKPERNPFSAMDWAKPRT
jgi:hypothetical protein